MLPHDATLKFQFVFFLCGSKIPLMKRETRISVRATQELKDRLKNASLLTGINETNLVVSCVEALLDYIDEHGEISMPLAVLPKSALRITESKERKTA